MEKRCNDRSCGGEIDFEKKIKVGAYQEGCRGVCKYGYPCKKCGLLHSIDMANFFVKDSSQVLYLKEEELIIG